MEAEMTLTGLRCTVQRKSLMTAATLALLTAANCAWATGQGLPVALATADHDAVRAGIEVLSEREAKQFYLDCSRAAVRGRLGSGETAVCSIGYDVLLKRHFGGDFHALLAWSRSQPKDRDDAAAKQSD
jgi:hypothetical protein